MHKFGVTIAVLEATVPDQKPTGGEHAQQLEIEAHSVVAFATGDLLVVTALRFSHRVILPGRHFAQQPNDRAYQA